MFTNLTTYVLLSPKKFLFCAHDFIEDTATFTVLARINNSCVIIQREVAALLKTFSREILPLCDIESDYLVAC